MDLSAMATEIGGSIRKLKNLGVAVNKASLNAYATSESYRKEIEMVTENKEAINMVAAEVHKNAVVHGWWDGEERTFGDIIALCHAELSEALEEHRNGHDPTEIYENPDKPGKLEGIPVELADTVIRIFDYCGRKGIDIGDAIARKHEYNKSRPYKHGGKAI